MTDSLCSCAKMLIPTTRHKAAGTLPDFTPSVGVDAEACFEPSALAGSLIPEAHEEAREDRMAEEAWPTSAYGQAHEEAGEDRMAEEAWPSTASGTGPARRGPRQDRTDGGVGEAGAGSDVADGGRALPQGTPMTGIEAPSAEGRFNTGGIRLPPLPASSAMAGVVNGLFPHRSPSVLTAAMPPWVGGAMRSPNALASHHGRVAEKSREPVFSAHQLQVLKQEIRSAIGHNMRAVNASFMELRASNDAMRRAQVQNSRTIEELTRIVRSSTESSGLCEPRLYLRPLRYASARLNEMSRTPSMFLCRRDVTVVASTSMEEGTQVSQPNDCTLFEFMSMAARLSSDRSVPYQLHPSEHRVRFADPCSEKSLAISFPSYKDLCDAVGLPMQRRVNGLFRERRRQETGEVVAAQVLGCVERTRVTPVGDGVERLTSKIFLGSQGTPDAAAILMHRFAGWFGVDWDTELVVVNESEEVQGEKVDSMVKGIDSRFSVRWTRLKHSFGNIPASSQPDAVLGEIRIHMPLVVLRGQQLIGSVGRILADDQGGGPLKETVCSTAGTANGANA